MLYTTRPSELLIVVNEPNKVAVNFYRYVFDYYSRNLSLENDLQQKM